jgi:hypothetical protein
VSQNAALVRPHAADAALPEAGQRNAADAARQSTSAMKADMPDAQVERMTRLLSVKHVGKIAA